MRGLSGKTVLLMAVATLAAAPSARAECAAADDVPADAYGTERAARAVVCLVNELRRRNDLEAVEPDERLSRAAERHAEDMMTRRYFDHESPEGRDGGDRAKSAGYHLRTRRWLVGENLSWGLDERATPAGAVHDFTESTGHRRVLLNPSFRDIGIAVAEGSPRDVEGAAATYVVLLGRRWR